MTTTRSGGYQTETQLPMSLLFAGSVDFHVRQSPDNNINYVWEVEGDVGVSFDDNDPSK